jgi:hypothetical protein
MNLRQWDEAKQLTVHLLEETPRYWEAQRLLLTLVERPEHVVTPE